MDASALLYSGRCAPQPALGLNCYFGTQQRLLCRQSTRIHGCTNQSGCRRSLQVHAQDNSRSRKGKSYENKKRRRGRPAWQRSPDDTPFRDGNRDRLIGLLTKRATRTLAYYLSETNLNLYHWLVMFMKDNPIPSEGSWDDVSGETFLRTLLGMSIEEACWRSGRPDLYECVVGMHVDPRNIAQRIMEIRSQIAKEMVDDLKNVAEENSLLMRETVMASFSLDNVVDHPLSKKDAGTRP
ncbi:hypothetical protein WJX72_004127 [[Myrmecia] bisecta]|uniref:Uncharacterized protein n=1 Tax=[Myrmecia] bisecta TaxID=41462 RepID=A0AAW1PSU5_9CHLO